MSRLALHLLGTPRLELDGAAITLSHHKAMALLAYLAVTGQPHTRSGLAALLWPDYDPAGARGEVRRVLWVINKSLGQGWLEADRERVLLLSRPDLWLDIKRFRELVAVGRQHGHYVSEVCPACLEPLTEAVALARGDFLAGFTLADSPDFDAWQTFETESLRRELAGALERLVQLLSQQREALGEQAINYARRWLALDPLHEPAHRQLMRLYTWSGQPAAALRQYQGCAQVLKEELGILPSAETTALYEAIKANRLLPPPQAVTPESNQVETQQQNHKTSQEVSQAAEAEPRIEYALPAQPTPFIGRQQEVAAIYQLLTQSTPEVRLVTLTGTGGTGKTRLSLQVAAELQDHFADGVFFVPLASLSDPQLLVSAIARQLDIHEGDSQPILQILKRIFQKKHLLLVLDNFEQIVTAAPVIAELLVAAPRLKVLVTSRALLHLRGEYEFLVSPLSLPDPSQTGSLEALKQSEAIQLFVERAQAASNSFTLTEENAMAVVEICNRLDGLPLAIELAAARIKLLPPQTLLTHLNSRFKILTSGTQDMPTRHQTLRNTIDWSYSLLDQAKQTLFSRLAVFVGGFTLETAEAICNANTPPLDILEGVTSLLNKSLLVQQDTSGSQPRFRMLETIREYALERLADSGQLEVLEQRHAHYFAGQIDQIGTNLNFHKGHWLDWAEEEYNNLQAILAWSQAKPEQLELGLRMVGVLYWFWYRYGYISEGRTWCQRFMTLTSEKHRTMSRSLFLVGSGLMALVQGDLAEAGQQLQESIEINRELQDEQRLTAALAIWGMLARFQGDTITAQRTFEETLALGERLDLWWFVTLSLLNLGNVAATNGDFGTARDRLEQAASLARSNDDTWLMASVLNNRGEVARIQGDYQQAQHCYVECQALRKRGEKPDIARLLHNLGYVALRLGDNEQAEVHFRESLSLFQELGNKRGMAECLAGLAGLAVAQDRSQAQRAARLLAAAEAQFHKSGALWWPADKVEVERNLATIRATLEPETLDIAWRQGQGMSLADAIAEVLG